MRPPTQYPILLGAAVLLVGGLAAAGPEGRLVKTERGSFEVVIHRAGVRVIPRGASGKAASVAGLTGEATFYHPNSPNPWFARPLVSTAAGALELAIGLDAAPATGGRIAFEISGGGAPTVEFTTPLEFAADAGAGAPGAEPRYVYGPGAAGFGYYQYPGPATAPTARPAQAVLSYPSTGSSTASRTRDWSTGRNFPGGSVISKPWLRPRN